MIKHILKRSAAVMTAAVMLVLCGCHEKTLKDNDEPVEITFSWWGTDERNEKTLNGLHIFTEQNGINVHPKYSEFTGYKSQMDVQMYSGTQADVMQLNYDWLYEYTGNGDEFYDLSELEDAPTTRHSRLFRPAVLPADALLRLSWILRSTTRTW